MTATSTIRVREHSAAAGLIDRIRSALSLEKHLGVLSAVMIRECKGGSSCNRNLSFS